MLASMGEKMLPYLQRGGDLRELISERFGLDQLEQIENVTLAAITNEGAKQAQVGVTVGKLALNKIWADVGVVPHLRQCLQQQREPTESEWAEMFASLKEESERWLTEQREASQNRIFVRRTARLRVR